LAVSQKIKTTDKNYGKKNRGIRTRVDKKKYTTGSDSEQVPPMMLIMLSKYKSHGHKKHQTKNKK